MLAGVGHDGIGLAGVAHDGVAVMSVRPAGRHEPAAPIAEPVAIGRHRHRRIGGEMVGDHESEARV